MNGWEPRHQHDILARCTHMDIVMTHRQTQVFQHHNLTRRLIKVQQDTTVPQIRQQQPIFLLLKTRQFILFDQDAMMIPNGLRQTTMKLASDR